MGIFHHSRAAVFVLCALSSLASPLSPSFSQDFMTNARAEDFFKEGVSWYNNHDYEAAIEFLRDSLGELPGNTTVRFLLGMAYYKAGYEDNARFEFDLIVKTEQDDMVLRNIARQMIEHMDRTQFLALDVEKSSSFTLGMALEGDQVGRYTLSKVTGVDLDGEGNIYAAGFGSRIALKLSPEGKPLHQFTDPRISPGRLYDIVVDGDRVYISDFTNDRVYRFSREGKYLGVIGEPGFNRGQFYGPTALAVDGEGGLYVVDSGNLRVQKFSPDGEFLLSFGRRGEEEGAFEHPSGIAVDGGGRIFVSDHSKKAVYVYDDSGNYLTSLEGADLQDPYGLSFSDGRLVVSDRTGVRLYDTLHSTWTTVRLERELRRVLDARLGTRGQLVLADFEQDQVLQFLPEEDRYRNLTVILNNVDASGHPAVLYNITVLDADGLPLYGLDRHNFLVRVGGARADTIDLRLNQERDSRLNLLFLVDKSLSMEQYHRDVSAFAAGFLEKTSPEDEVMVINYNRDHWVASSFTGSRLRTLDAVRQDRYQAGKAFDRAFRAAVDHLNKRFHRKAMVVLTDNLEESSFQGYTFRSCMSYAANNHIPVYFVVFGSAPSKNLDYFARTTGGRLYQAFTSNELPFLYETIRAQRTPEYLVLFRDEYDPRLKNLFVASEVEVDFNQRFGRSLLGFIYP
ncbi:MAG: VWA domain-containing protein [Spirochaetota bacterium]